MPVMRNYRRCKVKHEKRDMRKGNSNETKRIICQITSLKKSPCFLSSASIALSRIPPDVALDKKQKTDQIYDLSQ